MSVCNFVRVQWDLFSVFPIHMMDSDFIDKLQSITLTEEDGEVIKVGVTQRERMLEECSLSLLGRFLTTRAFN